MSHKVIDLTEDDSFADESHYSQLQRALALSLKDSKRNPVEEVLDDADPDLKEALRLSVVSQQTSRIDSPAESENHTTHENLTEEPAIRNFCGFDRRFMEQERLARLKRKHSATCIRLSVSPESKRTKALTSAAALITTTSCSGDEAQYLNGVIKLTHVNGYVKKEEHISIEEVFQKDSLQAAVLSSFVIDHEWVFSKLNIGSYPIVLVQHSGSITDSTQARQIPEQLPKVSVVFPPMGKARCMHSKLQLLFHIEFLRVVIPTANLIPQDWGEIGAMENSVFIQDFPRLTRSITTSSRFGDDLLYFCEASKYPENVRQKIKEFNFSGARVGILHSIGGEHFGSDSVRMTGFPLLAETVQRMGLQNTQVKLDYVTSSLGSLNKSFVTRLYHAACGISDIEPQNKFSKPDSTSWNIIKSAINVYFPTHETVVHSRFGNALGGMICLNAHSYHNPKFPKEMLRDCRSLRDGCLMHNKIIKAEPRDPFGKSWHYIGSANMSMSAWGNIVMDRTRKEIKLVVNNWEIGVLVPKGAMPVPEPVRKPGDTYGTRKPWFFMGDLR